MPIEICQCCGRALTQSQRWRHCKYCSRSCFADAQFGKKIEWNGIEVRPGQTLEILKLCQKGLTESEIRQATGADYKEMRRLRNSPEYADFFPERVCLQCGKSLPRNSPLQRRYCSSRCRYKAKYDRKLAAAGREKRQIDYEKRARTVELYKCGLDCGSIARHLDIPRQKAKNWIYHGGVKKPLAICPEIMVLRPLRHCLNEARCADEGAGILHEAAGSPDDSETIVLVCGTIHGSGAVGRYADIVLERLRQNLINGTRFAFCNVLYNAITTIEWRGETFYLTRSLKMSGTFAWPGEELGDFVTVSQEAFLHLIAYQKTARKSKYSIEKP